MIRTLAAVLLSGALGVGGVVAYDHYRPTPAPTVDLSAITQQMQHMQEADSEARRQAETLWLAAMKQQNDAIDLVHQDLLRQEAKTDAVRLQAQARVNHIQSDIANFQKAMPR